jgi:hypothetical protein
MVPRGQRQEALSFAYVRAVAAHAGLICAEPDRDFGVDLCLRQVRQRGQRFTDTSGQLDLQIKSTTRAGVTGAEVVYDLEVKNYNDLREGGDNCPRILVVLVLPEDEAQWLSQTVDELILRHCAYWISLVGFPATTSTSTVRISIPRTNIFSGSTVDQCLAAVRRRTS